MLLTRDQILHPSSFPYADVDVPDWGGAVRVRDMGAAARDRLSQFFLDHKDADGQTANAGQFKVLVCALTICDDQGQLLFSQEDVTALSVVSGRSLDLVYQAAADLNGLSAKSVEDAAKNSASPQAGSGTASPGISDAASPNSAPA
jgi:hypothetical protein